MNNQNSTHSRNQARQNSSKTIRSGRRSHLGVVGVATVAGFAVLIYSLFANAQQPVLTISNLGSNQFNIVITNAVTTTNYTLLWRPTLNDTNYPWQVLEVGEVGQTKR